MRTVAPQAVVGPARAGRRTKALAPTLPRGSIAVVDHADMDRLSAEALVERRVAAVVNAAPALSGRYPATGPGVLLAAGIPVFECAGSDLLDRIQPGDQLAIREDGTILRGEEALGAARPLTEEQLALQLSAARARVADAMRAFVENTLSYVSREWPLLCDESPLPKLRVHVRGKHVLVVVRGAGYREDLHAILPYVRDVRPVLIGVDGGADALLAVGLRPHVILGDMDSVSDAALRCGAELVVQGYPHPPEGERDPARDAPGLARVERLGLPAQVLHALGTSEDVALILAERLGAELIVAVGIHFSLQDFLDKGRKGMSSTFLARLKVGSILVDARRVSRLYRRGLRWIDVAWVVLSALVLAVVVYSVSGSARAFLDLMAVHVRLWLRHM
ncbi:MAG: hypothetical protein HY321_16930 [Armatimonadetes bacterium]|nr:hypothetical protein [Armatimonadota bacterium]